VKNFICTLHSRATDEDYGYVMSRIFWILREKVFIKIEEQGFAVMPVLIGGSSGILQRIRTA